MSQTDETSASGRIFSFAIAIAIIIAFYTIYFVLIHDPTTALPEIRGAKIADDDLQIRLASAESTKEIIGYLVSLTFALAAVVTFLIKDGLGANPLRKAVNLVLSALAALFIVRSLLFAYDAYGMVAIQLSEGYFLISRVHEVISSQARNLLCTLLVAIVLIVSVKFS